jgi:mono/diheme cytochrome c family protein
MTANRSTSVVSTWILAGALIVGLSHGVSAAGQAVASAGSGRATFTTYCATCHGTSAKGDGPMAAAMRNRPADLTLIAKASGGTFPSDSVARTIDGRQPVKGHGGGEMPVWGDAFAKSLDQTPLDLRIKSLVLYIESLQAK